jgi:hypothetical protein
MAKKLLFSIYEEQYRKDEHIRMVTNSDVQKMTHSELPESIRRAIQKWLKNEIKESKDELERLEKMKRGEFESGEDELWFSEQGEEAQEHYQNNISHYGELWRILERERLKEKMRELNRWEIAIGENNSQSQPNIARHK